MRSLTNYDQIRQQTKQFNNYRATNQRTTSPFQFRKPSTRPVYTPLNFKR